MVEKVYVTYNQVHKLCQGSADRILNDFKPNLMIAIGGGGCMQQFWSSLDRIL